jgi:diguanylate cyclase (GGDEF)-like protein
MTDAITPPPGERTRAALAELSRSYRPVFGAVSGIILVAGIAVLDVLTAGTNLSLAFAVPVVLSALLTPLVTTLAVAVAATLALGFAATWGAERITSAMIIDTAIAGVVLVGIGAVVGILRSAFEHGRRDALIDPLTGVLNRRGFETTAERERLRAGREGLPLSLAYFDLDEFKKVNDRLGHKVGDQLLARFAETVGSSVRGTDIVARVGGDEFVLLLPATDARQALVVVDRIRALLRDHLPEDLDEPLTASIGVATFRNPPESIDALVFGADDLMYEAKERGGDTVVGQVVIGRAATWDDPATDEGGYALTATG